MTPFFVSLIVLLNVLLILGMVRVVHGPTPADRMLAVMLFGTTGVAVAALLAAALARPVLVDVALILAVLAAVAMVAFVRDTWTHSEPVEKHHDAD